MNFWRWNTQLQGFVIRGDKDGHYQGKRPKGITVPVRRSPSPLRRIIKTVLQYQPLSGGKQ